MRPRGRQFKAFYYQKYVLSGSYSSARFRARRLRVCHVFVKIFQEYALTDDQMCLFRLLMLKHARAYSPLNKVCAVVVFFYAFTAPSPHVLAISLPSRAAWKSQHNPPPSQCHTYITCNQTALQHIMNRFAPLSFSFSPHLDTFNSLFSNFIIILHALDNTPTHTSVPSVCLSAPLYVLGTGANTLEAPSFKHS